VKLCLLNYNFVPDWPLDRLIAMAQAMGCAGLEFRLERGFGAGLEPETPADERRRIRDRIAAAGLVVAGLGTSSRFDSPDPAARQAMIERTKRIVELAADVDCRRIRVFGDRMPAGVPPLDVARYVGECLGVLGEYAAPFGVDVLLEMHVDFNDPELALTAVETANRANVALVYNSDPRDLTDGSVEKTYRRVAPWIRHVHLHDYDGTFPYQELFALLRGDGYDGFLSTEFEKPLTPEGYLLVYAALFRAWANQPSLGSR
jgi:sugar phosphate isomerase/epimerase